jgi:mono/diheme cytochrome c family protein
MPPMSCRIAFAVVIGLAAPLAVFAQAPAPPAAKTYVPGVEQFMNAIQTEHAKLWYAGRARNWPLATYQLAEIKELMSDLGDLVPKFKGLPFADMLETVATGPIADLEKAIEAKDAAQFAAGYQKLTEACNACHQATGNGFIVIRRPSGPAFPNQEFRLPRR